MSDDEAATLSVTDWTIHDAPSPTDSIKSDIELDDRPAVGDVPSQPIQKRRRVTRACDECRRKKIKCDGKQPCTHCSVYSYDCTYDKPSNRRRNPAPQYIEALEGRLHRAETLLRKFMPDIDLADSNMDPSVQAEFLHREQSRIQAAGKMQSSTPIPQPSTPDPQLVSMVDSLGQLDIDERGDWDFHGNSSGVVFLKKMKEHFRGLLGTTTASPFLPRPDQLSAVLNPDSASLHANSPLSTMSTYPELPPKDVARRLCFYSLTCATCLTRIVHVPTFNSQFERIYEIPLENLGPEDTQFLGLLFAILALGCMYHSFDSSAAEGTGYKAAMEEGTKYFKTARALIKDIGDCRTLTSIQALLFMTLFLQSTSNLSSCYAILGIAMRSCLRMGLHRHLQHARLNPIEEQLRKRIFYVVRQMDIYVSTMLGLPLMLSADDIDQPFPMEVDDDYVTNQGVMRPPPGSSSFFEAFNAHTRLMDVLAKISKLIYPIKMQGSVKIEMGGAGNPVSYTRIKEIEGELQRWFERLPEAWRPSPEGPIEVVRVRHLLRFAYAHVQLLLYRPFLHYMSPRLCQGIKVDDLSYACAAAAISVSRNVIHIGQEIRKQRVLSGPYWFMLYTEYFAVLSLIFFVLENPGKPASAEVLADARAGRQLIADLADKSMVADMLTTSLNAVFEQLPEALEQARGRAIASAKRSISKPSGMVAGHPGVSHVMSPQRSEDLMRTHSGHMSTSAFSMDSMAPSEQSFVENGFGGAASSSRLAFMPHSVATQNAHNPVNKLDALMFPSDDPFAYPNQPMMELGFQPSKDGTSVTMAQDPNFFFPGTLEEMGNSFVSQPPPYMTPQSGRQSMGSMNMGNIRTRQPQEQQQAQQIDQMFTEHGMQPDFGSFFGSGRGGFQGM
ncbi:hypothetical protein LMH87_003494 [Akanthomyces muscarius]|uniref:Zn(2)-C6 fungal-type domain-containing protein n=1 Tax=Akanthomyces muscarius TaxID=2231603 RepID=A0A9W8Q219_AKAMU|nr:hypothetical protein LMH87_003494 [Akanthomyces muscarius]KAJ4144619.1 hypothetical protein LMH87_003494 [Akanthomyces muscarius]